MSGLLSGLGARDVTAKIVLNTMMPGNKHIPRQTGLINLRDKMGGRVPIYQSGDSIIGHVAIGVRPGATIIHQGMSVELIGQIVYKRRKLDSSYASSHDFLVQKKELCPPGQLVQNQQFNFQFSGCDMPYESYFGSLIRVRYYLRYVCVPPPVAQGGLWRGLNPSMPTAQEADIIVHRCISKITTEKLEPLKMEVGIEDCLHIEFEYNRGVYTLSDVIEGRIIFFLAKLRVRHMEVDLLKVENVLASDGSIQASESEVVTRFELMDGVPPRNTEIPVRLFLSGQPTSQTLENVANRFSVRYYLNLVLVDEEERRYFKKQEIQLIRVNQRSAEECEEKPDVRTVDASTLSNVI